VYGIQLQTTSDFDLITTVCIFFAIGSRSHNREISQFIYNYLILEDCSAYRYFYYRFCSIDWILPIGLVIIELPSSEIELAQKCSVRLYSIAGQIGSQSNEWSSTDFSFGFVRLTKPRVITTQWVDISCSLILIVYQGITSWLFRR